MSLRQYHEYSLGLFPHQLLAVVLVVIVYDFGRRLSFSLSPPFSSSSSFPSSSSSSSSSSSLFRAGCVAKWMEVFAVRESIDPSIYRRHRCSSSSFFSCVAHNENWHEKLEITERGRHGRRRQRRHHPFSYFSARFLSLSLSPSAWNAEKMRRHTLSLPLGFANYEERTETEKARGKQKNRKFFPWLQPCRVRVDRKREDLARSMAQFVLSFLFPFGFSHDRREKHRPRQRRMPFCRSSSAVAITQISFFIYRLNRRRGDVQSKMSMPGTREIF